MAWASPPYCARNSSSSDGSRLSSSVTPAFARTFSNGATGPRTWQRTTRPFASTEVTPGTPDRSGTAPSKVASTVSAARCRISASVPISTSLPARRMPTRSQSASTSLRMCEERNTVWPRSRASRMHLPERLLHQRIEPARRLVQDEQVGAGHQRGDQDDLLPVALGVGADLLGGIELEPRDQLVPVRLIDAPLDTAEELKGLGAGEGRPQVRLTGHERQAAVRLDGLAMAVEAEDLAPPLGRVDEPQQQADRRGLARPVGAQVTDHLTLGDLEIEVIEGCDAAVALRQPLRAYGGSSHSNCLPLASRWPGYTRV